jgi:hypothetical protein
MVKQVPHLATSLDAWKEQWQHRSGRLGWHPHWTDLTAANWNPEVAETVEEQTVRLDAVEMLLQTISPAHTLWMKQAGRENPQAIFRRAVAKFQGSDVQPQVRKLIAFMMTATMASSNTDVVSYGLLLSDVERKLTDLNARQPSESFVHSYLAGLTASFDQIRFDVHKTRRTSPNTFPDLASVINEVEFWASSMPPDRNLIPLVPSAKEVNLAVMMETMASISSGTPAPRQHQGGPDAKAARLAAAMCEQCQTKGHTQYWPQCPKNIALRVAGKPILRNPRFSKEPKTSAAPAQTLATNVSLTAQLQQAQQAQQQAQHALYTLQSQYTTLASSHLPPQTNFIPPLSGAGLSDQLMHQQVNHSVQQPFRLAGQ